MERRSGPPPVHPILFAAAFILSAYVANSVSPFAMFRGLGVAIAMTVVVWALAWLALRSAQAAAVVATGFVALLVFGRQLAQIGSNIIGLLPAWQLAVLGVVLALGVAVLVRIAAQSLSRTDGLAEWSRGLNFLSLVLVFIIVATGVTNGTAAQSLDDLRQGVSLEAAPDRTDVPRQGPDIYVILLDGHAREDVLAERFDYDDGPFLDALEQRGFEVADASHSNYMFTQLTMTSMLHMSLLPIPALEPLVGGRPTSTAAREALIENPSFEFLEARGYTTVAFATPYENVSLRKADVFVDQTPINEFEQYLLNSTFLLDAIGALAPDLVPAMQRTAINAVFADLPAVAREASLGPRLVWAHLMAPHAPFVFGPHGEPLDLPVLRRFDHFAAGMGLTDAEFEKRFAGQTQYTDAQTLEAIDAILAASSEPPVIIVFSDHGSRLRPFDPATATDDDLRERFGTLFAAYTPGKQGLYPEDVTPSQIMVNLLNAYFGTEFPQPAGGTFASEISHPFDFTQVREPPPPPD
jgi:hypothetical protein